MARGEAEVCDCCAARRRSATATPRLWCGCGARRAGPCAASAAALPVAPIGRPAGPVAGGAAPALQAPAEVLPGQGGGFFSFGGGLFSQRPPAPGLLAELGGERLEDVSPPLASSPPLLAPSSMLAPSPMPSLPPPVVPAPMPAPPPAPAKTRGVVRWYAADKGYGFLSSGPGADVFVFQDDVTDHEARGPLKEGEAVTFTVSMYRGKPKALDVERDVPVPAVTVAPPAPPAPLASSRPCAARVGACAV